MSKASSKTKKNNNRSDVINWDAFSIIFCFFVWYAYSTNGVMTFTGASYRGMTNEKSRGPKPPLPPRIVPDLPPYIPRVLPPVAQHEDDDDDDEERAEASAERQDDANESVRRKRQSAGGGGGATVTDPSSGKPTYCDGIDEIGCFQVNNKHYYRNIVSPCIN